ncbi:hypothetical protein GIB67_033162 [Kingdonia uniflora]|uniref:MADS-box domain-containing protein n=1 Tax=Kingdonia uniflora TaxID=39325 RepID=A0A7J7LA47_9MAGN|nr:hypothetical protein GIB67_033162 [Kingdonia uniflora]
MGRCKITIEHINEKSKRQVTFSKRRQGIFSKATELSKLTGADVAIITFSPGGRPFTFSNKPVESILDRFLNQDHYIPALVNTSSTCSTSVYEEERLVRQYMDEIRVLEAEKKREEDIQKANRMGREGSGFWWEGVVSCETSLEELEKMRDAMVEVKSKIEKRVEEMSGVAVSPAKTTLNEMSLVNVATSSPTTVLDDCMFEDVEFIDDEFDCEALFNSVLSKEL